MFQRAENDRDQPDEGGGDSECGANKDHLNVGPISLSHAESIGAPLACGEGSEGKKK